MRLPTCLRRWWERDRTHRECRDCGASVTASAPACPTCGSEEIATYDLDASTEPLTDH